MRSAIDAKVRNGEKLSWKSYVHDALTFSYGDDQCQEIIPIVSKH